MRLTLFFTIEFLLALLLQLPRKAASTSSNAQPIITCKDDSYWYSDRKFFLRVKNNRGQSTTIVFDTVNINSGRNAEFVRYYFYKDIHQGDLISYSIITDTLFDGQVTSKFRVEIDSFYMNPALAQKI